MKTFRVFVTRHYISCEHFDIEAETKSKACSAAKKVAQQLYPNPRSYATDNEWQASEGATEIQHIGYPSDATKSPLVTTLKNGTKVYHYTPLRVRQQKEKEYNGHSH